mgnify:CR=1 FL=1
MAEMHVRAIHTGGGAERGLGLEVWSSDRLSFQATAGSEPFELKLTDPQRSYTASRLLRRVTE